MIKRSVITLLIMRFLIVVAMFALAVSQPLSTRRPILPGGWSDIAREKLPDIKELMMQFYTQRQNEKARAYGAVATITSLSVVAGRKRQMADGLNYLLYIDFTEQMCKSADMVAVVPWRFEGDCAPSLSWSCATTVRERPGLGLSVNGLKCSQV